MSEVISRASGHTTHCAPPVPPPSPRPDRLQRGVGSRRRIRVPGAGPDSAIVLIHLHVINLMDGADVAEYQKAASRAMRQIAGLASDGAAQGRGGRELTTSAMTSPDLPASSDHLKLTASMETHPEMVSTPSGPGLHERSRLQFAADRPSRKKKKCAEKWQR